METKNECESKSYVTKEKNFKTVKGLQKNVFSKIVTFCEYLESKAETKKYKG